VPGFLLRVSLLVAESGHSRCETVLV
jgi:hypothetical protein